jgi:hypothetical protein
LVEFVCRGRVVPHVIFDKVEEGSDGKLSSVKAMSFEDLLELLREACVLGDAPGRLNDMRKED